MSLIDETLYVFDQNLQRMSLFSKEGNFIESKSFEDINSPIRMNTLDNGELALIYPGFDSAANKQYFAHIYDSTLSDKTAEFLPVTAFNQSYRDEYSQIEYINRLLAAWQGSSYTEGNMLYYIPYFYNSEIFLYEKMDEGNWELKEKYSGQIQRKPISFISENYKRKADIFYSSVTLKDDLNILAHCTTRGFFKVQDRFVHFTFTDIGENRIFGAEFFDVNMKPIGYSPIDSVNISDEKYNFLDWSVDDVDKDGNFYLRERYPDGMRIRRISLNTE